MPPLYEPEPCPCGQGHPKMKGSSTCRVCGRWMEGGYNTAPIGPSGDEARGRARREMDQGHCDTCVPVGSTNVPKILTSRPHHIFSKIGKAWKITHTDARTLADYALALEEELRQRPLMSGYDLEQAFEKDEPVEMLFTGSGTPTWVEMERPVTEDTWPMKMLRAGHRGLAFVARRKT